MDEEHKMYIIREHIINDSLFLRYLSSRSDLGALRKALNCTRKSHFIKRFLILYDLEQKENARIVEKELKKRAAEKEAAEKAMTADVGSEAEKENAEPRREK
jgi:chromatin remodeling complex protein RSC6